MILVDGIEAIRPDIEIPMKYGVDQCIGDTLGPGGVFRALRTIPVMVSIVRDMEELCPNAYLLNYTNPMSMNCWAMYRESRIKLVGLCHSVQGTAALLAGIIGADMKEVDYWVAGINHQAWFLEFKWKGKDAYPLLREKMDDRKAWKMEEVRREMFRRLDYFVTESSGHNSEYVAWFRKRPDLLKKYCAEGDWAGGSGFILKVQGARREHYEEELENIASGKEPIDYERSHEYGSYILNALETGEPFRINANVPNDGLITNLPDGSCVEVPVFVDRGGFHPAYVGDLPAHLAALNGIHVKVQQLAVEAALEGDRRKVFHAIALDPLTSAVCSLEEIQNIVDELFEAHRERLPQFS
jgi:alpha-galactosidase